MRLETASVHPVLILKALHLVELGFRVFRVPLRAKLLQVGFFFSLFVSTFSNSA